ncbi:hypothetical protein BT96DRAFT_921099 [Gymnopus androsaceus JB14]|uniref:Uncharacterized protein n=1 Tax=Gymnopus androsaceus JB14 TaxID=1447944 RepID=A0A6A4HLP6_9AGAR|nr:hypothetical protein BT96DRAFT_921099 [Gymnopus androsaceus JB14]
MVLAKEDHVFFTLPPKLHTHIFTLACSPSSTCDSTVRLPYYAAFGILAFECIVSCTSTGTGSRSRIRYLTLVADKLPQDVSAFPQHQFSGIKDKVEVERLLLEVIARILRVVGEDLYKLELGFQVIKNIKDPLGYLLLLGPGFVLFSPFDEPSTPWIPHMSCPCLEELMVVCSGSITTENWHAKETGTIEDDGAIVNSTTGDMNNAEQALAALDVSEAAWDVRSALAIDVGGLGHKVGSPEPLPTLFLEDKNIRSTWPPLALQTIVLQPKSHWNERWASLHDVVKRQQEETEMETECNEEAKSAPDARFEISVLKPGEQPLKEQL